MHRTNRQAIVTKYLPATSSRGSRIKATAQVGSVTVAYDCDLDLEGNHDAAAKALADKYEWPGEWFGGGSPDGRGNVYVCVEVLK